MGGGKGVHGVPSICNVTSANFLQEILGILAYPLEKLCGGNIAIKNFFCRPLLTLS